RQRRWLEKINDFELEIHYHPGKANLVADALSRKSYANVLSGQYLPEELSREFERLNLGMVANVTELDVEPTLEQEIRNGQLEDEEIKELIKKVGTDKAPGFRLDDQGTVLYGNRIVVPDQQHIKDVILREAHESAYSIHPGSTKMYLDLKERFWWYGLKRDV
ncbi:hypothetical protein KFY46_25760, partial [Salmonella enterica subsp. enterica serovar 1,4,[5],12:i:-]|nr:hypothetical protein [Salmonella enterica subsp. enterica serovar 1,4,[5],12:i:-]